jgi:uncharacterized protein (TIGR04255 family)
MHSRIPVKLRKEPLFEAVWEIRFTGTKAGVADLLPGLIFKELSGKYSNIVKLPAANIPDPIVESDPKLKYMPKIRIENGNQAVQIGEHAVSLSCKRPYSGWSVFSTDIRNLARAISQTGLVKRLDRFSLKYMDLITLNQPIGLECLDVDIRLGQHAIEERPVQFRTEIVEGDLVHIIQIVAPARVALAGNENDMRGVLLDIDTIKTTSGEDSWEVLSRRLDDVHLSCKKMFFSLMTPETIAKLEPEYEV